MTNKERLYSLDPHELTAWFESEHVEAAYECPLLGRIAELEADIENRKKKNRERVAKCRAKKKVGA